MTSALGSSWQIATASLMAASAASRRPAPARSIDRLTSDMARSERNAGSSSASCRYSATDSSVVIESSLTTPPHVTGHARPGACGVEADTLARTSREASAGTDPGRCLQLRKTRHYSHYGHCSSPALSRSPAMADRPCPRPACLASWWPQDTLVVLPIASSLVHACAVSAHCPTHVLLTCRIAGVVHSNTYASLDILGQLSLTGLALA